MAAIIRCAALPLLLVISQAMFSPAGAQGDDLRSEFSGNQGNAKKRLDWFYKKRAFPHDTLQHGYVLQALEQVRGYGANRTLVLPWQNIGPQPGTYYGYGNIGGRVPALVVHPTNASIAYIGAADGGVWKTTDGGTTWLAKTDFLASLATGSLAIDPSNPERIYWGTGEPYYSGDAYGGAGVFQSTDGGTTWSSIGLSAEKRIPRIEIDPTNGSVLFAATWGGVYRTSDGGGEWTKTLNLGYGYDVVIHPTNSSILYAGIGDNSGNAGIYKSTNNGVNWTKLTTGLPASGLINRIKIDIARSSPSTVYALMSSRSPFGGMLGVFKSTNDGASWEQLAGAPENLFGSNNQGWYDIQLGVSPTNPNLVFAGGLHLHRTTDGGSTWSNVSGTGVHADQHAIGFGPGVVYVGNDGGVWKSTNNGSAWINLNASLAVTQFYSAGTDNNTPSRIYGGTQDNGTQRTAGGLVWMGVLGGDGGMVVVDHSNSAIVYGETQNGNIYKSTDGGTSFSFLYSARGTWITPVRLDPVDASVVYTANTRVMRSTNGGTAWSAISDSLNGATNIQWLAIHPTTSGTIYAASNDKIYRTMNGGTSWLNIGNGLPSRYIEQVVIDPNAPSTVYAVFSGTGSSHVFRSMNKGITWSDISGDLPDVPASTLLVHPGNSNTLYLGTDIGLFITSDGGSTWMKETGLPNVAVTDLALTSDSYLIAATHGRSMFKTPLATQASVTLVEPNGGEDWLIGSSRLVMWNSMNLSGNVKIELSRDGGTTFSVIVESTVNDGDENWIVSGEPTSLAVLRISSVETPDITDVSNGIFHIAQPSISVTSPDDGSVWVVGSQMPIRWSSDYFAGNVTIELSRDGGVTFPEVLFVDIPNDGVATWTVTGAQTAAGSVRVSSISLPAVTGTSTGAFSICNGFDFLTTLAVEDNGEGRDTLWFGSASGATDGIDAAFGEFELPPRPPLGVFDVRWSISGTQGIRQDVRAPLAVDHLEMLFAGTFQDGEGGYPFILRWDPDDLPAGTVILRDQITGGLLFKANMKLMDSLVVTNPAIESFEIAYTNLDTLAIPTSAGWNMVSLPVAVPDQRVQNVFPTALSDAYSFTDQGYAVHDTIKYGLAYWIVFGDDGVTTVGMAREQDTISVNQGWNMVGSINASVPVESIEQIPEEIILSDFIGSAGPSNSIEPGRGYWVKIGAPGKLVLRRPPVLIRDKVFPIQKE